jgi:hypothetical protein
MIRLLLLLLLQALAVVVLLLDATPCVEAAAAAAANDAAPSHALPPRRALKQQSGFYHRLSDTAWRQTDISVRHEQQTHMILQRLRRGGPNSAAEATAVSTALLGSQNFEKRGSTREINNLNMNLRRYARPGQGGALGAVYRRIHPRVFETGDKDTDFRNNVWSNVALRESRTAQIRHEADLRRSRQVAYERGVAVPRGAGAAMMPPARELTDVVREDKGAKLEVQQPKQQQEEQPKEQQERGGGGGSKSSTATSSG